MENESLKEEIEEIQKSKNSYGDLYSEAKLYDPISKIEEKWKLVPAFLKVRGLVKQHIDSYNYFTNVEIKNIVRAERNYLIKSEIDSSYYLKYKDIRIGKPSVEEDFSISSITPHQCRLRNLTYDAPILVDIQYKVGDREKIRNDVCIGRMPIMLGSSNCYLTGKTKEELAKMQECPYDPKGYFIIKGVEKVILIHEQMSKNRIIIDYDSKGNVCAQVTSSTHDTKTRTGLIFKNGKIYLKHNSFSEHIPIVIVFKAIGILSDQEIVQLIGHEYSKYLIDSLAEAHNQNIYTRNQALKYISTRLKSFKGDKLAETLETLGCIMLANVPVIQGDFGPKSKYLAIMVKRLLDGYIDPKKVDDKDYYGNKRLELAGQLLSLLFEDLFKKFNLDLKKIIDMNLVKDPLFDVYTQMRSDTITRGLVTSISTGNWVVKRFKMKRAGITQLLNRMSYIATLGMMTRINSQFEKTRKISGPRSLQPSQWGMLCPTDTPEGESCGLVKNLALLSHITTDQNEMAITNLCISLGVEELSLVGGEELNNPKSYIVYVNGSPIGLSYHPKEFCENFRNLRREGYIHEFVSISKNDKIRSVSVACDGGRLTRPLILLKNGKPLVTQKDINLLIEKKINFIDLTRKGKIEFVDVNEENDILVALSEKDITLKHTHLEIAPFSILGVVAGLIPYPHHNQSPRNTYQSAMGKQAIGSIGLNQFIRTDTLLLLMVYPQKPLCTTITIELTNYDKLPAGHNACIAVMCYSGYDIEDAVILNKASLDRGFGRIINLRKNEIILEKYPNGTSDIRKAPDKTEAVLGYKRRNAQIEKQMHAIDKDGLAKVGSMLTNGDVFVNKYTPSNTKDILENIPFIKTPVCYKGPVPSYVDRVILTTNPDEPELIKVMLRQTRRPELGDKFSSRHGQKGVCGMIVPQEDMPFSETGWVPDLIMNPHGYPSRMTVGKLIELIAGKSAVFDGKFKYGTAFAGDKVEDISKILVANGYSYSGKDLLYSGITGEPLNCYVFCGPIFYQRLKHMVLDKMHARSRGPKSMLTRQPLEGRSKDGGLRLGEMERDCLIGYGASCLVMERLMLSSDLFYGTICSKCGFIASPNYCFYCQNNLNICQIKLPYAFKLLTQELMSMNIKVKFKLGTV